MAFRSKPYTELTVLVIDDDAGTRRLLRSMLQMLGVRSIAEASDGHEGLQEVIRSHPDVVLCDVHMAPLDGQDFLRRIRESRVAWMRQLPVVFLTGDASAETVRTAKQQDVDGYLVKPVSPDDLKKRIDGALSRGETRRDA
jgi:two-component system chemotaxis response regulator CheY